MSRIKRALVMLVLAFAFLLVGNVPKTANASGIWFATLHWSGRTYQCTEFDGFWGEATEGKRGKLLTQTTHDGSNLESFDPEKPLPPGMRRPVIDPEGAYDKDSVYMPYYKDVKVYEWKGYSPEFRVIVESEKYGEIESFGMQIVGDKDLSIEMFDLREKCVGIWGSVGIWDSEEEYGFYLRDPADLEKALQHLFADAEKINDYVEKDDDYENLHEINLMLKDGTQVEMHWSSGLLVFAGSRWKVDKALDGIFNAHRYDEIDQRYQQDGVYQQILVTMTDEFGESKSGLYNIFIGYQDSKKQNGYLFLGKFDSNDDNARDRAVSSKPVLSQAVRNFVYDEEQSQLYYITETGSLMSVKIDLHSGKTKVETLHTLDKKAKLIKKGNYTALRLWDGGFILKSKDGALVQVDSNGKRIASICASGVRLFESNGKHLVYTSKAGSFGVDLGNQKQTYLAKTAKSIAIDGIDYFLGYQNGLWSFGIQDSVRTRLSKHSIQEILITGDYDDSAVMYRTQNNILYEYSRFLGNDIEMDAHTYQYQQGPIEYRSYPNDRPIQLLLYDCLLVEGDDASWAQWIIDHGRYG